jgi:hypothetical protein
MVVIKEVVEVLVLAAVAAVAAAWVQDKTMVVVEEEQVYMV